jgi:hypothetical protein
MPAKRAPALHTVGHADQRRHDVDAKTIRMLESLVADDAGHALEKGGVVLAVNGDRAFAGELAENWNDQGAGRTVTLDDSNQALWQLTHLSLTSDAGFRHEPRRR